MTVSLNVPFAAAIKKRDAWNLGSTRSALSECKERMHDANIDWEEGDENWGRILQGGKVILLICALVPIAFVLTDHYATALKHLGDCPAVPVESFSQDDFSIDRTLLTQILGREVSANVNYEQLSIDDIWWATV